MSSRLRPIPLIPLLLVSPALRATAPSATLRARVVMTAADPQRLGPLDELLRGWPRGAEVRTQVVGRSVRIVISADSSQALEAALEHLVQAARRAGAKIHILRGEAEELPAVAPRGDSPATGDRAQPAQPAAPPAPGDEPMGPAAVLRVGSADPPPLRAAPLAAHPPRAPPAQA